MCRYIGWNRSTGQEAQTLCGTSREITRDRFLCLLVVSESATHGAPTERGVRVQRGYKPVAPPERNSDTRSARLTDKGAS